MLNNEKIILMTKLSLYEQKNQKSQISTSKYFKGDYVSLKMISSFLYITIAYMMGLAITVLYAADKLLAFTSTTGVFTGLIALLLLIYVVVMAVYMTFCHAFYSHKFRQTRKKLNEYNGDLKTLHRIQELEYDAIIDELEEQEQEETQW
ncbi:MAG: hypothetical protein K6G64_07635 [Eubacterium sp.]|nr:hypothetical protein [Eubacterium sp.]